jgi:hypothetical protein
MAITVAHEMVHLLTGYLIGKKLPLTPPGVSLASYGNTIRLKINCRTTTNCELKYIQVDCSKELSGIENQLLMFISYENSFWP